MKVLFLNYEYPPLGGGAANATKHILQEYANFSDLEVDLITSSIDQNFHLEKMGEKVRIHKLPIGKNGKNIHFQSKKDLLTYSWKAYFYARKLTKKNHYDLTHSFFTLPCGFISLLLKWEYKLPYIVSLRGSDVPGYSDRFPLIYAFLKPLFSFIWKKSFATVSNSQGLKELALHTNPKQKIDVIYNGIDIENFKPKEETKNHQEFIITPGASRITARKGLNYLIEAVAKLAPKYPQIKLKLMGEGNEKKNLEELVKKLDLEEKIKFIGQIPHEKVLSYYQEASVFVLPSLNEGMSNAMLEALAVGLPIISTPTGGAEELVQDGENGFIIKVKNSQDIAEKIERLLINPELARSMGQKSQTKAENLSWKNVAEKYFEIYKNTK